MAHNPLILSISHSVVNESNDRHKTTAEYFKHYVSEVISLSQAKYKKSHGYAAWVDGKEKGGDRKKKKKKKQEDNKCSWRISEKN